MTARLPDGNGELRPGRAGRAAAAQGRPVGRHERRPRPVQPPERHLHSVPATGPATRAGRRPADAAAGTAWAGPSRAARTSRTRAARGGRMARATGGTRVVALRRVSWAGRVLAKACERWATRFAQARQVHDTARPTGPGQVVPPPQPAVAGQDPAATLGPRHLARAARRAGWHEDALTGWCSVLLVLGLYLGGWGQQRSADAAAGSMTLWGGLAYLGFVATAVWVLGRQQRRGDWSLRAVPAGYRLGLAGMVLALAALAGEAVWSLLGGPALARPLSPLRLLLLCGAGLLVSSALRATWSEPTSARVPGLRAFWPVVLSATLLVAVAAHAFQDVSPLVTPLGPAPSGPDQTGALAGLLVHNLLLVGPVLLLLRRWRTPPGTFTVLAGSVALLLATQTGFALVGLAGAAVLGGAAADVAVSLLRPSPQRAWAVRAVAVIAPAVCWSAHFALLAVGYGAPTSPETWVASVAWAALSGFGLALLAWPPAVPLTAWNRGRPRTRAPATATATAMPARMVGR